MNKRRGQILLKKYLNGTASESERMIVELWYAQCTFANMSKTKAEDYDRINNEIWASIDLKVKKQPIFFKMWLGYAAAVMLLVGSAMFFLFRNQLEINPVQSHYTNDIGPGKNLATIRLAGGQILKLSESKNGVVIDANKITYNDGVGIDVPTDGKRDLVKDEVQTISTPQGGTYQITLSDGTKVWLNAASSLTYSASLNQHGLRQVTLDGEAYFEVAKDKTHPFIVNSKGQQVRVLGTHFNISAYADEKKVKTTLLEGVVQVNNELLKPNEQSVLENNKISINPIEAKKVIAWKNGKFLFTSESIESIMKKLARWYNVEVIYNGDVSNITFTGSISQYDNISKILDKITFTQAVHFKIEGRRITVMP